MIVPDDHLVAMPAGGAWRVHRDPTALPAVPSPGQRPPGRFDDPQGRYRVRYLATTRRGAFLEVLAWLRRQADTGRRLEAVSNVAGETVATGRRVPPAFLERLQVARGEVSGDQWFVDVAAPRMQTLLGRHPHVAHALETAGLGGPGETVDLDEAVIRLAGRTGRAVTQTISRVVFEGTDAAGIRSTSRIDATEECWAVFETIPVSFSTPRTVVTTDDELRAAVGVLGLQLPA